MASQRFCPNCGSTTVEPDFSHTNQLGEAIFNQDKWLCIDCDYRGLMPVGDPEEMNEGDFEFDPEEQETIDTDFGRAYWKYFLYISLPAVVLYILFSLLKNLM